MIEGPFILAKYSGQTAIMVIWDWPLTIIVGLCGAADPLPTPMAPIALIPY